MCGFLEVYFLMIPKLLCKAVLVFKEPKKQLSNRQIHPERVFDLLFTLKSVPRKYITKK